MDLLDVIARKGTKVRRPLFRLNRPGKRNGKSLTMGDLKRMAVPVQYEKRGNADPPP